MATLLLTAVGTAVGGPLGGALGALVGQQADRALFGGPSVEGPRVRELSVTTSSYGQPIARHFGQMRVAGTVIWATDLIENSSTEGGKGRPKTTTYSYSANFAVAISSTPISRLGRIWADGNLLRGSGEDLKVEGELRVYLGNGDAPVDPLIAADKGAATPAFRQCAYVVFENLQLADFGNRIPALTFEIFSASESQVALGNLVPGAVANAPDGTLEHIQGFSDEGGPIGSTLSAIGRVLPLFCVTTVDGLRLSALQRASEDVRLLPEQRSSESSIDASERYKSRAGSIGSEPMALRYYDIERDYQPGVQRTNGRRPDGQEAIVDLPAALNAQGAKALANGNANRGRWQNERLIWRISELDPSIGPGALVAVPLHCGVWIVESWEWSSEGIELHLKRAIDSSASALGADGGETIPPQDVATSGTILEVFELPADSGSEPARSHIYAALASPTPTWRGASLVAEEGDSLIPIEQTGASRSVIGALSVPLRPSGTVHLQPAAAIDVRILAEDQIFADTDIAGLARGANRLLVGGEVVQFQCAQSLGSGQWRLSGLLRGRAGTEDAALVDHPADTPVVLLNDRLVDISYQVASDRSIRVGAIGRGDEEAVMATLRNAGLSRRPLIPVHPRSRALADGSIEWCWTRRARGHWRWDFQGEIPLVEETESYLVGYGPVDAPMAAFETSTPSITFSQAERDGLVSQHGPAALWVCQVGTFDRSKALLLTQLA